MKKWILDNLPGIWVVAVFVIGMALVANHANATETGKSKAEWNALYVDCLLYTSPSQRDRTRSRMPSSA